MAEGWAGALRAGDFDAWSAGTAPHGVDPRAVAVMAEAGVDISSHTSKHIDDVTDVGFDCVVTVCDAANEACPFLPGDVVRIHKSFPDPPKLAANAADEDEALGHYRRVRDEIKAFVETLNPATPSVE
jgi:arsenate reductase